LTANEPGEDPGTVTVPVAKKTIARTMESENTPTNKIARVLLDITMPPQNNPRTKGKELGYFRGVY
jgi:hypothetical protein